MHGEGDGDQLRGERNRAERLLARMPGGDTLAPAHREPRVGHSELARRTDPVEGPARFADDRARDIADGGDRADRRARQGGAKVNGVREDALLLPRADNELRCGEEDELFYRALARAVVADGAHGARAVAVDLKDHVDPPGETRAAPVLDGELQPGAFTGVERLGLLPVAHEGEGRMDPGVDGAAHLEAEGDLGQVVRAGQAARLAVPQSLRHGGRGDARAALEAHRACPGQRELVDASQLAGDVGTLAALAARLGEGRALGVGVLALGEAAGGQARRPAAGPVARRGETHARA